MGIHCQINLFKPVGGRFTPGSVVAGSINYAINKETIFKRVTVSLKGKGILLIKRKTSNSSKRKGNSEEYVNVEEVIHGDKERKTTLPIGSYETHFKFLLPEKVPSTLHCKVNFPSHVLKCHITYNICIEFEKSSRFKFNRKFEKEITVISGITPRSLELPTVCELQKSLTQWFSKKKSIVYIKATIQNRIVKSGHHLVLEYEVNNDTNIVIKSVKTKLVESYTFISKGGRELTTYKYVKDTDSKSGSIQPGDNKTMPIQITVPFETGSLEYSKIVKRDYAIYITANLPLPHRDAVMKIPVQIGNVDSPITVEDQPPPYWVPMSEDTKKSDGNEEEQACESDDSEEYLLL